MSRNETADGVAGSRNRVVVALILLLFLLLHVPSQLRQRADQNPTQGYAGAGASKEARAKNDNNAEDPDSQYTGL